MYKFMCHIDTAGEQQTRISQSSRCRVYRRSPFSEQRVDVSVSLLDFWGAWSSPHAHGDWMES